MENLVFKRIIAWFIDFAIIALYATLLFGVATFFGKWLNLNELSSPILGQLIGLITLTIPVVLYFYLFESGKWMGTVGKKMCNLKVVSSNSASNMRILMRNILKFLPWEIAHTGVHWIIYYSAEEIAIPLWVWVALILPQILVFIYFLSVLYFKGQSSIYDKLSKTTVQSVISLSRSESNF